ncbi:hypothetical protein K7X08_029795 [Anisodus acutangulus]|uniref:Peptidyl-prolyl cis-trans isomerase n=1 Tax=Anisodus acutangulus TaxID=402998 RepID=A0A9Q1MFC6_9SOLA|nr:hypothetical protein K7X08_029795 [Anisodus acutangulus]
MDMNTLYGGFAAAVVDDPLWVMNVVSSYAPNTLPVVYDRGLIGTLHDWCEAFSTYPRTYDLLHLDGLFSAESHSLEGSGGDSIYKFLYGDQARFFGDEIHSDLKPSKMGTVAMANAGESLNTSQFHITLREDLDYLDGNHTVFGEISEGFDTLNRINEAYVDDKVKPFKNIRIKHTYILDDPSQVGNLIPDASPERKPKDEIEDDVQLDDDWVPMDEQLSAQELRLCVRKKHTPDR